MGRLAECREPSGGRSVTWWLPSGVVTATGPAASPVGSGRGKRGLAEKGLPVPTDRAMLSPIRFQKIWYYPLE